MWRWELVSRLASDLGVNAMAVQTGDGLLLSKLDDRAVLPWLARYRNFGDKIHDLMSEAEDILRDGGTYLDIGANLGVTTLPLAAASVANQYPYLLARVGGDPQPAITPI